MEEQKPNQAQKELDVEFSQEKNSVIREAFQHMYSQTGEKEETQIHQGEDA